MQDAKQTNTSGGDIALARCDIQNISFIDYCTGKVFPFRFQVMLQIFVEMVVNIRI